MNDDTYSKIKCRECDRNARWMVWYEGFGELYNCLCTKHANRALRNTKYPVIRMHSLRPKVGKVSEVTITSHGFVIDVPLDSSSELL